MHENIYSFRSMDQNESEQTYQSFMQFARILKKIFKLSKDK